MCPRRGLSLLFSRIPLCIDSLTVGFVRLPCVTLSILFLERRTFWNVNRDATSVNQNHNNQPQSLHSKLGIRICLLQTLFLSSGTWPDRFYWITRSISLFKKNKTEVYSTVISLLLYCKIASIKISRCLSHLVLRTLKVSNKNVGG